MITSAVSKSGKSRSSSSLSAISNNYEHSYLNEDALILGHP